LAVPELIINSVLTLICFYFNEKVNVWCNKYHAAPKAPGEGALELNIQNVIGENYFFL
jgi:hypothetical protein